MVNLVINQIGDSLIILQPTVTTEHVYKRFIDAHATNEYTLRLAFFGYVFSSRTNLHPEMLEETNVFQCSFTRL